MKKSPSEALLHKYNRGEASPEEKALLESWYLDEASKQSPYSGELDYDSKRSRILEKIQQNHLPVPKMASLWPRIVAVAAVLCVVISIFYFFNSHKRGSNTSPNIHLANDIAPGKMGATLTLANGEKIRLNDAANGAVAKVAGVSIRKMAGGQLIYEVKGHQAVQNNKVNNLTTAKGETYVLMLPDKSKIWLNAASSLTYFPSLTVQGARRVKLEGEAYFEIAKDKAHPFIVECQGQEVKVLGTHFNINAYSNEPDIKTTLLEGHVKVTAAGIIKDLTPGYQAVNAGNAISVNKVDTELVMAWKNNVFLFENEALENIMRQIERWYNVEVIYQDSHIANERFGGGVSKFGNVSEVLKSLQATGRVHFNIDGRKIYVN